MTKNLTIFIPRNAIMENCCQMSSWHCNKDTIRAQQNSTQVNKDEITFRGRAFRQEQFRDEDNDGSIN